MSVLNKKEIEWHCKNTKFIEPFDMARIKYASYDLSVGPEYRLSSEKTVTQVSKNGVVEIPPYEVCFILTEETIKLPNNTCALIFSRHRAAKEGFLMHPQPPIDPGYKGKLYILLHNLSNQSVYLHRGEHLASIVFFRLEQLDESSIYGSDQSEDRYMGATSLQELVGDRVYSPALREVSNKVSGWKEDLMASWLPNILVVVTFSLLVLTILFAIIFGLKSL